MHLYLFRLLYHTKNPNASKGATRRATGAAIAAELVLLDSDASSLIPSYVLSVVEVCLVYGELENVSRFAVDLLVTTSLALE